MSILEAIVLGLTQGLTEFLPISSSGHLVLVPWLFGWEQPGLAFDAALHLGTLLAVFVYFRHELWAMILAIPTALRHPIAIISGHAQPGEGRAADARLGVLIVLGSIPAGIVGLIGQDAIGDFFHSDEHQEKAILVIALLLIGFGLLLWLADRTGLRSRLLPDLTVRDALTIGIAQAFALIPGVSRSGVTLTAGLFRNLKRADAARFSFLLGVPLILAAGLTSLYDIYQSDPSGSEITSLGIGLAVSAISGFAAISGLLRFLQTSSTLVFVVYRVIVGLGVILLLVTNIR